MDEWKKVPMPVADPNVRNKNFEEVAQGYTEEQALAEASRCFTCKHRPCVKGCPVGVPIPEFIAKMKVGDFEGAAEKIREMNLMPAICGRVCPQEKQCESLCVRGRQGEAVSIGRLERFAADYMRAHHTDAPKEKPETNGIKVAVVGSGPAGLTCAGELARKGYEVTVFEALHKAGGVLEYGIPEFRLPKEIVDNEIHNLELLGVTVKTNYIVGKTATIDELMAEEGFKAVFIGSGAGLPNFMNIPGEELNGVYSANEFLTRINLMKAYKKESATPIMQAKHVSVIGGGNVAMDAARCALRIGAESVSIVYRRTEKELPARLEEIEHAKEEGVQFCLLTNPVSIEDDGNGWVGGLKCVKMELGEPDATGRARPVPIPGSEFILDTDCVVMAIGNSPNPLISRTTEGLQVNKHGCLVLRDTETWITTRDGIYAGGDAVTGAATVILAMGAGKAAAASIDTYLQENK
ncbi:MAG: NADPH-dependent glutamate synthase [Oscillospiraceae bacterium]|nr:NADPH-dependent glutamate synthase [Oscillospiraceae bacterium]